MVCVDQVEQLLSFCLKFAGAFIVTHFHIANSFVIAKLNSGLRQVWGSGRDLNLSLGCHRIFVAIHFYLFAFVVSFSFSEKARTMTVNVRVKVLLIEGVNSSCPFLWNMLVSKRFTYYTSIFALKPW